MDRPKKPATSQSQPKIDPNWPKNDFPMMTVLRCPKCDGHMTLRYHSPHYFCKCIERN